MKYFCSVEFHLKLCTFVHVVVIHNFTLLTKVLFHFNTYDFSSVDFSWKMDNYGFVDHKQNW